MFSSLKMATVVSYLWVVVHIITNFAYVPILIHALGRNEYGLYQIVGSFFAYINILETSISSGVLRFYCNAQASNDQLRMENVLATCRRIYRYLSVLIIGFGVVCIIGFNMFYKSSLNVVERKESSIMLVVLFCNLLVTMNNSIYLASINANEHFVFAKGVSIISHVLQPLICALILYRAPYALTVVLVQLFLNMIVAFARYWYAKKKLNIRVVLHDYDKGLAKNVLVFAGGILLSSIADQIFWKTDQLILGKLYNTAVVAVYAIGAQIYTNYMYAGTTVASVFFPRISKIYREENATEKLSELFIKVGRIAFQICFLVFSGFVVFGKEFLVLWVGESFLEAYYIAIIVMIPFTVDVVQNIGLSILQVANRYGFRARMYFVAALLNVVLTMILARTHGGIGAAASTALTMLMTSGFILNWYYSDQIGLDILRFWKNIFELLLKQMPLLIAGYLINLKQIDDVNIITLLIKIMIYSAFYIGVAYVFVFNGYEKELCRSVVKKVLQKRG